MSVQPKQVTTAPPTDAMPRIPSSEQWLSQEYNHAGGTSAAAHMEQGGPQSTGVTNPAWAFGEHHNNKSGEYGSYGKRGGKHNKGNKNRAGKSHWAPNREHNDGSHGKSYRFGGGQQRSKGFRYQQPIGELIPEDRALEQNRVLEQDYDLQDAQYRFEKMTLQGAAGSNDIVPPEVLSGYDKTKSFFDNISCDATDHARNPQEMVRGERGRTRQQDRETFGSTRRPIKGGWGGAQAWGTKGPKGKGKGKGGSGKSGWKYGSSGGHGGHFGGGKMQETSKERGAGKESGHYGGKDDGRGDDVYGLGKDFSGAAYKGKDMYDV